jgi:hypothetical protein
LQSQCNILRPLPAIAPDQYLVEADGDELPCEIGARAAFVIRKLAPEKKCDLVCCPADP